MMNKDFYDLIKSLVSLQKKVEKQTLLFYESEVEKIISTKSKDTKTIEHILDALGEVAFDEKVLVLFKKLLRYYFDFNPSSVAMHIQMYREMWDCKDE